MEQDFNWQESLDYARKHLYVHYRNSSLEQQLSGYFEAVAANDPLRALQEMEKVGDVFALGDWNFWPSLEVVANELGFTDLGNKYWGKREEAYVDGVVKKPANCRGLPTVNLISMSQASLILLTASGVAYHNQTAGIGCDQRAEEGALLPLVEPMLDEKSGVAECPLFGALYDLFTSRWGHMTEDTAKQIDAILGNFYWTKGLTVDRSRLAESEEAWVYVNVDPLTFRLVTRLNITKAVLIWPNSD
jgi:hypothetical protein